MTAGIMRIADIALDRLDTPEDIACGVLFLASEQGGWIMGPTLAIDGGRSRKEWVHAR